LMDKITRGRIPDLRSRTLNMHTFRVKWSICRLTAIDGLMSVAVWAQGSLPKPAPNVEIVRVKIGYSCGWCTEGYNDSETVVEPLRIVSINRAYSNKKKYPNLISEERITKGEWKDLQTLIETKVLDEFTKPAKSRVGPPDAPVAWTELHFKDGSKKSLAYAPVELEQKIAEIGKKAWLRDSRHLSH
jgi:hypothetical protein